MKVTMLHLWSKIGGKWSLDKRFGQVCTENLAHGQTKVAAMRWGLSYRQPIKQWFIVGKYLYPPPYVCGTAPAGQLAYNNPK